MKKQLLLLATFALLSTVLCADEVPSSLNYRSFHDKITADEISEFTIYKSYDSDVDAIAKDKSGKTYIVDRPYQYEDDEILIDFLKTKGIELTILDEAYQGKLPDKAKHKSRMMWMGSLFYLIPIALIVAIVLMAKAISRQSKTIQALSQSLAEKAIDSDKQ